MQLTSSQRTLLIILSILWALYFCTQSEEPIHNVGALNEENKATHVVTINDDEMVDNESSEENVSLPDSDENEGADEHESWLKGKFQTRNQSKDGERVINFAEGSRDQLNGPDSWERNFDTSNRLIASGIDKSVDQFVPMDESGSNFASFNAGTAKCGSNQKCEPEDLFNADNYLPDPKEVNDDWFDTQYEPVSVKNRHLINVTRPIGVTTIGSSKRNAGRDIRGTPACPKFVVAPWNNSSISHDDNLRNAWA